MTASSRRCSTFGLCLFVFFTGSLAFAQDGGAAGEGSGGAAGEGPASEGGAPAVGPGTRLGRACVADADCQDGSTPDLQCISATQTVLGDGAPPHGLCTSPCVADVDCDALSVGSLCFPFNETGTSYCVEGCSFGEPPIGEAKCHGRSDFACNPALLGSTSQSCTTTASCGSGEVCVDDVCNVVFPACLPSCRGDIDCADGMYCDQSFLSGVCLAQKPAGKGLAEPCTVKDEPDECLGFCQADAAGSQQGHCSTVCGIGTECAWNATSGRFDGVCLYASVLTAETGSFGDFGFCTPSCNCSDECGDASLECQEVAGIGRLPSADFRGPGLCFSPDPGSAPVEECAMGGAGSGGGAGGEPSSNGGTSNGGTSNGATSGTSGGAGSPNDPTDGGDTHDATSRPLEDSGCGCKLVSQRTRASSALWLLPLLGIFLRRRRSGR
jgi:hypothetical protein